MSGTGRLRCWGIFRELAHSPGRETDDALILKETARVLESNGFDVRLLSAEDLPAAVEDGPPAPFWFVMCERLGVLDELARWESRGVRIVNSPEGIRNTYRDRTAAIFEKGRVSFPESVLVSTADRAPRGPSESSDLAGVWIKRGDVHATEAGDVVRAASSEDALIALAALGARGVPHALIQRHVAGDLIKFYGVGNGFGEEGDDASGGWFEWFYHRDQDLRRHPFDAGDLARAARHAAAALGLEIWGGDAIVGEDGKPVVIDLNAWPSFALYREAAGRHIAAHLVSRFQKHVEAGVAE